jgi:hypothetical protein
MVALMLGGCADKDASTQGGVIRDVTVAAAVDENDRPINPTTVFAIDTDAFYCSFELSGFPAGTRIMAEWIYVGGEAEGENSTFEVDTGTIGGDGYTSVSVERPTEVLYGYTWPKGDYKIVLSVEGEEKASASFKVE